MQAFAPRGVIPALVTPFTEDGANLDCDALRRLLDHVIGAGVHGVFVAGSQGEFWALSFEEKVRLMEATVDMTAGRVPVYAGTGAVVTSEAVALTREAARCKVDAVSVLTPYFITPNEEEVYTHFKTVAAAAADIPVLLYLNTPRTGVRLSPALVRRLAAIDNIVGIKDSNGDLSLSLGYLRAVEDCDFSVLMGRDTLIYAGLAYGAKGSIAAGANAAPALMASIYDKFMAGDTVGAMAAQSAVEPLRTAFDLGTFPVVIKEALNMMGIQVGPCRAPVGPLTDAQRQKLRAVLDALPKA